MSDESEVDVLVGTCGFAEAQDRIFQDFDILEVQKTFYQPPMVSTAERWREKAPADFVFTVKAWQLLTHEASSPTFRRLKEDLSDDERAQAGSFRWNDVTRMAYERTQAIAEALDAEGVLFQTPASFEPTEENLGRLRDFFGEIDRHGRRMMFEPRGEDWDDATVRQLVRDLDLVHAVDPFIREPVGRGLRYFRLHGKPAYSYRYEYTAEDLSALEEKLTGAWTNRVLFNNYTMADDARRFLQRIR